MIKVEKHMVQPGGIPILLRHTPDGQRKPAVLVVPGGGRGFHKDWAMKAFPMDDTPFMRVYIDLPQHGDRGDPSSIRRQWLRNPVGEFIAPIIVEMRKDLSSVIDYLQGRDDVDAGRIGACGWSIGGMSVILAIPRDRRINSVVTVAAAQSPRLMLHKDNRGVLQWPIETPATPEEMEWLTREEDPETWASLFYPTSVLLLHGTEDLQVPSVVSRRLYESLLPHYKEDPSRLKIIEFSGAGHRPTVEMAKAIKEWFEQTLM